MDTSRLLTVYRKIDPFLNPSSPAFRLNAFSPWVARKCSRKKWSGYIMRPGCASLLYPSDLLGPLDDHFRNDNKDAGSLDTFRSLGLISLQFRHAKYELIKQHIIKRGNNETINLRRRILTKHKLKNRN